jgi:hypothetical protein
MALPTIVTPEYQCVIPSTGQDITYRPFLMKEEKLLLLAQESGEINDQTQSIITVLQSCILTPGVDVSTLATFDLEYVFLKLRSKSVGEVVEFKLSHQDLDRPTGTLENTCTHETPVNLNIDEIQIPKPTASNKINITDDIGVVLRYPTFKDLSELETDNALDIEDIETTDNIFKLIIRCVDYIYDKENVYNEFTEQEMTDWVGNLNQDQFQKITEFYEKIPKLEHELKWTCPECKKEETLLLEGMQSFFI